MPRRKPTPEPPKRASGPTIPESRRKAGQVLLRLSPVAEGMLRDQSAHDGLSMSTIVSLLMLDAWGDQYEEGAAEKRRILASIRSDGSPDGSPER